MSSRINHGDNYETHPFDLRYMLERWAVKESDVVWDPFVSSGQSQREIERLGYRAHKGGEDVMRLKEAPSEVTIIITNPPFSNKGEVLAKLASLNVPFVVLLPTITIQRDFFKSVVAGSLRHWSVVLPTKSLFFTHNGVVQPLCAFKSCFIFSCPAVGQQQLELSRIENVAVQFLDYDEVRRRGGWVTSKQQAAEIEDE